MDKEVQGFEIPEFHDMDTGKVRIPNLNIN